MHNDSARSEQPKSICRCGKTSPEFCAVGLAIDIPVFRRCKTPESVAFLFGVEYQADGGETPSLFYSRESLSVMSAIAREQTDPLGVLAAKRGICNLKHFWTFIFTN